MEKRCDPELRLSVGGQAAAGDGSNWTSNSMRLHRMESWLRFSPAHQQQEQKKQMTILYKGRIFVCDATEMQARAIISMAEKMEEIIGKQNLISQHDRQQEAMAESTVPTLPPTPSSETLPKMLNPGQSMKRSLQRFLQKRKARASEVTPYKQTPKLLFPLKPQHA
ncbi:protein TIFY 5A-like [Zingiber officinale]|uniref:Protein TIFY n=1 Tax=Zingiber officinale TaxID=94328 RepID=A0A8J5CB10_ZINOF|nr:protein TIFY 5A-like [Zingiber officinale]KAG6471417.1 hypothetical protein ZIOFF_068858 [Zingiber officinale]